MIIIEKNRYIVNLVSSSSNMGLRQGDALSQILLNMVLDRVLNKTLRAIGYLETDIN